MTVVYHELLPESYLLILAPGRESRPETGLAYWLGCAQQSGKPAVWVDCGMLKTLSSEAIQLLWHTHYQLQEKHAQLVLVHVQEHMRKELLEQELGPAPCIVPTLLDAARQTGWREVA
ncbi:STAS domain-containing protein [Hymenobacter daeguensis]